MSTCDKLNIFYISTSLVKLETLYLVYRNFYGHQTWHGGDFLPRRVHTLEVLKVFLKTLVTLPLRADV